MKVKQQQLQNPVFPQTYLCVSEMLAATTGERAPVRGSSHSTAVTCDPALLFLKYALLEGGMGVRCFHSAAEVAHCVETESMPTGSFVIQHEVTDLVLVNDPAESNPKCDSNTKDGTDRI